MSSRRERVIATTGGAVLGGIVAISYGMDKASQEGLEYSWQEGLYDALKGMALGGAGGFLLAEIFGSPADTVNYSGHDRHGRVTYHGVTGVDRVPERMAEHARNGKRFDRVKVSTPRPRTDALSMEKTLIKRDRPALNIQHNRG